MIKSDCQVKLDPANNEESSFVGPAGKSMWNKEYDWQKN